MRSGESEPASDTESGEGVDTENENDENVEESNGTTTDTDTSGAGMKEFSVTASQFTFEPNTIRVKKGDKVVLKVKSIDVTHGIAISEFNVNEVLNPGEERVIEFTASETGTYSMFCSVVCGSGHADMKGTLIVE